MAYAPLIMDLYVLIMIDKYNISLESFALDIGNNWINIETIHTGGSRNSGSFFQ